MAEKCHSHVVTQNPEDFLNPENPIVKKFMLDRESLISQEKSQRSDHEFRGSLSPTAAKACEIFSQIRAHEQETIWSSAVDSGEELFPGMIFNAAKSHMQSTQTFQIISKMPKGALLHCHLGAMVDLSWVFGTAIETEGMCISSSIPLIDEAARGKATVKIEYGKDGLSGSIWDPLYVPGTQIHLKEAALSFPGGGRANFISWLKSRSSVTQSESVQHHLGINDIWRKLVEGFTMITPIVFYEPITRKFLREFFRTAKEDGIFWIEMRGMTRSFRLEGASELVVDRTELVRVINEEVEIFIKSEEGKGFWGVRMIWDCLRSFGDEMIIDDMKQCLRAKTLYPTLLSGYDLVGPEDHGRTLHSLAPLLLWFRQQCTLQNINIPFFFHAGETLGSGDPTDHNLFDALLFSTRRIGHGFSLYKHPVLISMVKEKNILIESCPISNEVLRYTASVTSHPLPALLNRGVKVSLSNDDPSMMGQGGPGMSCDFWQAVQGWEDLGLEGLGSMAQNSVRWAAFEDQKDEEWIADVRVPIDGKGVRAERIRQWNEKWESFCTWIVEEFGKNEA